MKATSMFFPSVQNCSYSMDAIGRMDKKNKFLIAQFLPTNKAAFFELIDLFIEKEPEKAGAGGDPKIS